MTPILLDTCAAIWIAQNEALSPEAVMAMDEAFDVGNPTFVSPITAWEVGLLVSKERLALTQTPGDWFKRLLSVPGYRLAPLTPDHFIQSSFLPGTPPRDPGDRIMAATARAEGFRLMTRDRLLLAYADQGYLDAIAC